ncbi:MAG: acyl-CoA dehydrogenase family protein, partial [Pseudomonadota bacterium]
AMTTLLHERGAGDLVTPRAGGLKSGNSLSVSARSAIELAKNTKRNGQTAADDPLVRDRLMRQLIRENAFSENQRRASVPALNDHPMRLALQNKLLASELSQDTAALALDIAGPAGSLYLADENAPARGQWPLAYMNSYGITIAAGTSEIQRNILGERVLGLAKSK